MSLIPISSSLVNKSPDPVSMTLHSKDLLPLILINLSGKEIARAREVCLSFHQNIQANLGLIKKVYLGKAETIAKRELDANPHEAGKPSTLQKVLAYMAAIQAENDLSQASRLQTPLDFIQRYPNEGLLPYVAAIQAQSDIHQAIQTINGSGCNVRTKARALKRVSALCKDPLESIQVASQVKSDSEGVYYRVNSLFNAAFRFAEQEETDVPDSVLARLNSGRGKLWDYYSTKLINRANRKQIVAQSFQNVYPYQEDLAVVNAAFLCATSEKFEEAMGQIGQISISSGRAALMRKIMEIETEKSLTTARGKLQSFFERSCDFPKITISENVKRTSEYRIAESVIEAAIAKKTGEVRPALYELILYDKKAFIEAAVGIALHDIEKAVEFIEGFQQHLEDDEKIEPFLRALKICNPEELIHRTYSKIAAALTEKRPKEALTVIHKIPQESPYFSQSLAKFSLQLKESPYLSDH